MPIQNRMAQVRRSKLQDGSSTSQDRATRKRRVIFSLHKFCENGIEYIFELLYRNDLMDAKNVQINKE